jgi:L-cysteine S-thiosulfotransferase
MRGIHTLALLALMGTAQASDIKPARDFLSPDLAAQQDDPARHPGWLWVEQGEALWRQAPPGGGGGPTCASCHGSIETMRGVATRLPAVQPDGSLRNLEGAIEHCRQTRQNAPPLGYESEGLLSLSAAIARQSRGLPMAVKKDGPAAAFLAEGARLYTRRQGQLNLACTHCHDENAGQKLRGDTISHGLGTGYPAYRLEWSGLGSLHRRLRACQLGVRAVQHPLGAADYLALELYLAARAQGLAIEAPGLRR